MRRGVHIQKLPHCPELPAYATPGAAAMDLCAARNVTLYPGQSELIPTGIALSMPDDTAALLIPRSGLGARNGIVLANLVGLIDSDYTREVFIAAWNRNTEGQAFDIKVGDRIAQMMFTPVVKVQLLEVDSWEDNGRGGFGHTGV